MFLPGQDDINKAVKMLNEGVAALPADSCMDLLVLPIYAALPPDLQVQSLLYVVVVCRNTMCRVATGCMHRLPENAEHWIWHAHSLLGR